MRWLKGINFGAAVVPEVFRMNATDVGVGISGATA